MENVGTFAMQPDKPAFAAEAERRYAALAASGMTIAWTEMRRYLENRIAGRAAVRPASRKLAR